MAKLYFAALLAVGAASVAAQPSSPTEAIQPFVDSAEHRQILRNLSACLAEARPRWARRTLSHPYLSDAQASAAAQALNGTDKCIRGSEAEVTLRTSGLVGSLAEHFLRAEIEKADSQRLAEVLYTLTPLNASEDFALCVAQRNPAAARDLALSEPGSAAETEATGKLATHVAPCINKGEQLTIDLQSLRALTSTALYRGVTTVLAARH
jgi:hypothetical protein